MLCMTYMFLDTAVVGFGKMKQCMDQPGTLLVCTILVQSSGKGYYVIAPAEHIALCETWH